MSYRLWNFGTWSSFSSLYLILGIIRKLENINRSRKLTYIYATAGLLYYKTMSVDSTYLYQDSRFFFTIRGRCGFTEGSEAWLHTSGWKFIISSHSCFHPSSPRHQPFCRFFYSFTHILLYLSSYAAAAALHHFQVCKCKILPTGSYYLFSWSNRVHVSLSVQSVGLTCLCSSRSALFPTRIIGNSSLSFTRRICLWNL